MLFFWGQRGLFRINITLEPVYYTVLHCVIIKKTQVKSEHTQKNSQGASDGIYRIIFIKVPHVAWPQPQRRHGVGQGLGACHSPMKRCAVMV